MATTTMRVFKDQKGKQHVRVAEESGVGELRLVGSVEEKALNHGKEIENVESGGFGKKTKRNKNNGRNKSEQKKRNKYMNELNSRRSYGPIMAIDHSKRAGDPNTTITYAWNEMVVFNLLSAMIAHASSTNMDFLYTLNTWYCVRFLRDYVADEWNTGEHALGLDYAPKVFWDLLTCGKTKKVGPYIYQSSAVTTTMQSGSFASWGCVLGTSSSVVTGYTTMDVTGGGYTAQLGYTAVKRLFEDAGDVLRCVKMIDYPGVPDNDASAFVLPTLDAFYPGNFLPLTSNSLSGVCFSTLLSMSEVKTPWIARLQLFNTSDSTSGEFAIRATSFPASIFVDRMINNLSTYDQTSRIVRLKFVDVGHFLQLADAMMKRVELLSTTTPWVSAAVGFDDFKILMFAMVKRWCGQWLAVGTGAGVLIGGLKRMCFGGGSLQVPVQGLNVLKNFAIIEKNLSCLFPYMRSNCIYYPVPFASFDLIKTGTVSTWPTETIFTATWNMLTGLVGVNDISTISATAMATLATNWNYAMTLAAPCAPISGRLDETMINLSALTTVVDNTATEKVYALLFAKSIPDHLESLLETRLLPVFPLSSPITQNMLSSIQTYYREYRVEPYADRTQNQFDMRVPGFLASVHGPTQNIGTDDGENTHDDLYEEFVIQGMNGNSRTGQRRGPNSNKHLKTPGLGFKKNIRMISYPV